jgi:hypothetical protein
MAANRRAGRGGEGLHVRVTFADGGRIKRLAAEQTITLSDFLRSLINVGLEKAYHAQLEPMLPVGRPRKK